jgi:two-component system, NtrC family, sensor kinase
MIKINRLFRNERKERKRIVHYIGTINRHLFKEIQERKQLEAKLKQVNKDLQNEIVQHKQALENIKAMQSQLLHSEKMAELGQLVASITHEINTPLGAIRSSVNNLARFLDQTLMQLPNFFDVLSKEQRNHFSALLQKSLQAESPLTAKEERQLKRALIRQLKAHSIEKPVLVADTLVDMGIYNDIEPFLSLLSISESPIILQTAYKLSGLQRSTNTIEIAVAHASKVLFALKNYARYDHIGERIQTNIIEGIETILTLYHHQIKPGIELCKHYSELPLVLCYPDELNQVWTNLIHNALQAMDYKGTLTIEAKRQDEQIIVKITDSGIGIPLEVKSKIFTPFFTTKPPGEGSGLGLDIVKRIIEKHEGDITVESQPGKTTFCVSLPIHLSEAVGQSDLSWPSP